MLNAGARRAPRWVLATVGLSAVGLSAGVLGACSSRPAVPAVATTVTAAAATTATRPPPTSTILGFEGRISRVTAADLPTSWRPGCPVGPEELRLLHLTYWGFDDRPHPGALVVHASVSEAIVEVFRRLYERRFPIRRMELVDVYGGSDEASIAADNTSGFNCRNAVSSGPPHWSAHAYGRAVDVNPVENPYLLGRTVLPPAGAAFLDRSDVRPGMAVPGGELTGAFAAARWSWGGAWGSPDYQHFSETGD